MRRANKILMATVAILLCLVLITTSVVSGVFAKYAIKKQASTSVSFQSFGVTVELTPDSNLKTLSEVKKGDSASVMFEELPMAPGDEFYKALKVEIGGKPNVDIVLRMTCHIEYETSDYTVDSSYYMPLGYTIQVGEDDDTRKDTCYPYKKNTNSDKLEEIIVRNSANELFNAELVEGDLLIDDSSDYYYSKKFDAASTAHQKTFYLGFDFPDKGRSRGDKNTNFDPIVTALSEKATPITIVYSFTIEQA